jgi:hypothetical protein
MIKPEEMSLLAHKHIQTLLNDRKKLSEDEVNSVYRLSQHLRVFGLLSVSGYINHNNNQDSKNRNTNTQIWSKLLAQLLDKDNSYDSIELMKSVIHWADNDPKIYMLQWRRALELSQHWNFWARAYKEPSKSTPDV